MSAKTTSDSECGRKWRDCDVNEVEFHSLDVDKAVVLPEVAMPINKCFGRLTKRQLRRKMDETIDSDVILFLNESQSILIFFSSLNYER